MLHREQSTFTYIFFHVLLDHNLVSKSGQRVGAYTTEKTEAQALGWGRGSGRGFSYQHPGLRPPWQGPASDFKEPWTPSTCLKLWWLRHHQGCLGTEAVFPLLG